MKIYTEEQVKELMDWTIKMAVGSTHSGISGSKINENAKEKLASMKPLELPTEFANGAKWMKQQILKSK